MNIDEPKRGIGFNVPYIGGRGNLQRSDSVNRLPLARKLPDNVRNHGYLCHQLHVVTEVRALRQSRPEDTHAPSSGGVYETSFDFHFPMIFIALFCDRLSCAPADQGLPILRVGGNGRQAGSITQSL
jgi:hypothetical protein